MPRRRRHPEGWTPNRRGGQSDRCVRWFAGLALTSLLSLLPSPAPGAELGDPAKLPPAATVTVDFRRDIAPLLETACLRCHGPEKPKGGYRLDTRAAAIRGGDNGAAIVAGNSAASPLVHYVARLVEDMEMPPAGKGEPLTPAQVALVRVWIDQGVKWEGELGAPAGPRWSLTVPVRWIEVRGDAGRFREHHWQDEDWGGGVSEFKYRDSQDGRSVAITARALAGNEDYGVTFELKQRDLGFVRGGVEQFRRWTDDSGGYYPLFDPSVAIPQLALDRELYLDIGRAWIDLGLTLPDWPRVTLGYEYQWRNGSKSLLQWGLVDDGSQYARNIYPSAKEIDERNHLVKLDVEWRAGEWELADSFRGTFSELKSSRARVDYYDLTGPAAGSRDDVRERHESFTGANTLTAQRQWRDWLFTSAGYLYSKLNADEDFARDTGGAVPGNTWRSTQITLERESHVANLNGVLGPWESFTLALGAQADWTHQEGLSLVARSNLFVGTLPPLDLASDLDILRAQEFALLRYTGLPFATLYAEGRLEQERVDQAETDNTAALFRDTDAATDGYDARAGFNASLGRGVTWNAHYRRLDRETDYDHRADPYNGYSAFILDRRAETDEAETRVSFNLLPRVRASLSYQWRATDYHTTTDQTGTAPGPEGRVLASTSDAHVFGALFTVTALRNLTLTTSFNYQDLVTRTRALNDPALVPYEGGIYSVWAQAHYRLNAKTDLQARYSFSHADFAQDNAAAGLPLGLRYTQHTVNASIARQMNEHLRARVGYGYATYDEPTSGGLNDYQAHLVFTALTYVWQ